MPDFGKLNHVDLREIWTSEARDFTPWLAENIQALGEAIGLELELQGQEESVGEFALDILAKDLGSGKIVIIENQLTPTDHLHLGQLLTYASGFDAGFVIWVSESFREEHRQALDWLNQRTDSETQFFGVSVEVIKIDESKPAFNFKTVVMPNEWRKSKRGTAASVTPRAESYRKYFQALIDDLRDNYRFTNARVGQPQSWYSFTSGYAGFLYTASFAHGKRIRAELYIDLGDSDSNKEAFDWLHDKRGVIESAFGSPLEWERLDSKRASRIAIYREGSIDSPEHELIVIHRWTIDKLLKFKEIFTPLLEQYYEED